MDTGITQRQLNIMRAIMNEFLGEDDTVVASSYIVRTYKIKACPATVRNEMVELERKGFLTKPHFSAGRLPSDVGIKFFLSNMLIEDDLSVEEQARIRNRIMDVSDNIYLALQTALEIIVDKCGEPAWIFTGDLMMNKALYKVSRYREMQDYEVITSLLYLLENSRHMHKLVQHANDDVFVIVGKDMGLSVLHNAVVIGKKFKGVRDQEGAIGIISSKRMYYSSAIPVIRFVGQTIEQAFQQKMY